MGERRIKIGVAGCGWIAEKAHLPALQRIEGVEIVSLCDSNLERAREVARNNGIANVFDHYAGFLESDLDAVVVATPNYTHADFTLQALAKGKHVLCEKPLAFSSRDVRQAIELAQKVNKLFLPGFVNRFREDIQKGWDLVQKQEIGRIRQVKAGWVRRAGMPRPGTWFTNKKYSGGGVLLDLGSHVLDIGLMFLKDETPQNAELQTWRNYGKNTGASAGWFSAGTGGGLPVDVEDTAQARVEFQSGAVLEVELSWCAPVENDFTYFTISGTGGEIQLRTLFGFSLDRLWPEDSLIIRNSREETVQIPLDRETNNTGQAFLTMADYLIKRIMGAKSDYLTMEDGFRTAHITEMLYQNEKQSTAFLKNFGTGCEEIGPILPGSGYRGD